MFRLDSMIRTACAAAVASVALSSFAPLAHAADALPAGAFAVVNGVALPQTQLDNAAKAFAARLGQPDTPQMRAALKQDLIVREVVRQAAEKKNYGSRPEVKQIVQAATVDAETQLYVNENSHPQPVTDAQVKARYDAIVASFGKEEFRPSIITVSDAAAAQKVMGALKAGQAFDALARQYSIAPTKAVGGEMPWVSFPLPVSAGRTQGLPVELAQAIAKLPVGGVTPQPVQVGNVWAIVKLNAKRPTQTPTFDQTKAGIREQLQALAAQKAVSDLSASLLKGATIRQ